MEIFTANDAKQHFGELMDKALQKPVSITKHGRPSVVVTSEADYRELMDIKQARLQEEVQAGFDAIDRGEISSRTADEIAMATLQASTKD